MDKRIHTVIGLDEDAYEAKLRAEGSVDGARTEDAQSPATRHHPRTRPDG